jgi:catechol-2,3-dioxygenase
MQITKLDHVNVQTTQLTAMIDWYTDVLGLTSGPRPNFPFAGAWMYAGDTVMVHLVEINGPPATGSEDNLKLEHFAFKASGSAEFEARLKATMTDYRSVLISQINTVAFNLWDPDGNHIHVDFVADEKVRGRVSKSNV